MRNFLHENVERWAPNLLATYRWAYPYVVAAVLAAWAGTWYQVLRPGRGKLRILLGSGLPAEVDGAAERA